MKNLICLTLISLLFTGCNEELKISKEYLENETETETETGYVSKVELIFSDPAVTNFSQTSGLAKNNKKLIDYLAPKAFAGSGNISCLVGEPVSFTMDVFGNTLDIDATCSKDIDKRIRVLLLQSLADKTVRRTVTSDSYNDRDVVLDFSQGVGFFVKRVNSARNGGGGCKVTYEFNLTTGTAGVSALDQSAQTSGRTGQNCGGALSKNISFRFSNGYLELDLSNTENFSPSNVFTDQNGNIAPSYERYEICNTALSSDNLPTSIGDAAINLHSSRNSVEVDLSGNIDCSGYGMVL